MIEIYGKPACPSCTKAKAFCEKSKLKFSYYELDTDFTRDELFEQFPTARTFPQIKINGSCIGGYEQMIEYIDNTGYNGTGFTL
jgi:glutaredoxin 3